MTEIPEVKESGGTGTQEATSTELVLQDQESPFQPTTIVESVQGLASSNARSMGGAVVATLLSGSFAQLHGELQDTKSELKDVRKDLEGARDQLSTSQKRVAVLEERVSTNSSQRHLRNTGIAGGSIILGVAIQIETNTFDALPYLLGAIGILFMLMGWFWPSPEKDR